MSQYPFNILHGAAARSSWESKPSKPQKPPMIQLNAVIPAPVKSGPTIAEKIQDGAKGLEFGVTAEGVSWTRPIRRLVTGGAFKINGVSP